MIAMRYQQALRLFLLLLSTSCQIVEGFLLGQRTGLVCTPGSTSITNGCSSSGSAFPTFLSNSASSSYPSSASVRAIKRKKSKLKKGKNANKNHNKRPNSGPISLQDLAEHVSHEYIHGSGGLLRNLERKRGRFSRQYQQAMEAAATHQQEQAEMIRNLDRHPALVLNADFQPLSYLPMSIWNWQEAIKAVFSGKVTVVDVYPDVTIRAASLRVPLPSVIALTEYVTPTSQYNKPAFTKRNVFLRDEYRCQYCNDHFHTRDLSLDHVVPRCRGGDLSWENAVTCCMTCNGKKGSMGLQEIQHKWGMRLRTEPRVPTSYELAMTASRMLPRQVHPTWEPYLPQQNQQGKQSMMSIGAAALQRQEEKQFQMEEEA